jgi:hypothetical protein
MIRQSLHTQFDVVLRTRLSVLTALSGAAGALLTAGVPPVQAAAAAVAGALGGVRVGCQLTQPYLAPETVVSVMVLVLVVLVSAVRLGYPLFECLAVVLAVGWCSAELIRRATAAVLRPLDVAV